MKKRVTLTILCAALLTGALDIAAAFANAWFKNGVAPDKVLRFIASGVFGREAFSKPGASMPAYGLLFHFFLATIFAFIFFKIYPVIKWLSLHKIAAGILYGLIIWAVMNLIVVPLSYAPSMKWQLKNMLTGMGIVVVAIGLPLSFWANKFYRGA